MASTHTLTGNVFDLAGVPLVGASNIGVRVVTNLGPTEALVDKTTNRIHLGGKPATVDLSGNFTVTLVDTSATDLNVVANTLEYQVEATYTDKAAPGLNGRKTWTSGWFPLTTDANLADITTDVSPMAVQSASAFALEAAGYRDEAESARTYIEARVVEDLGTSDAQWKALADTPSSQTAQALVGMFGLRTITLAGNIILSIPSDAPHSSTHNIVFRQNSAGNHLVSFPTNIVMAEGASFDLSLVPDSESVAVFRYSPARTGWVCEGCWASYVPSDETGPIAGTLTATPTAATNFTVTISGAADETELAAAPYALSVDGGAYAAWQTSPTFTLTGLSAGSHTLRHKVRDTSGNETLGTLTNIATIGTLDAEIAALSPAGFWKLTETSGTVAADSSGNGRNGTYSGSYSLANQAGMVSFTNGAVTIPDNDAWSVGGSTGFSVFALYRPATGGGGSPRILASKADAGALEWNLQHRAGSTVAHSTVFGSTGSNYMDDREITGTLVEGVWHAVVAAMPTPTAGAPIVHYVDSSTPRATTTGAPGASSPANGSAPLRIGNRGDVSTSPMVGALGRVAIFRSKLTSAQVNRLIIAARTGGLIP